jgi:hypothetical protein
LSGAEGMDLESLEKMAEQLKGQRGSGSED